MLYGQSVYFIILYFFKDEAGHSVIVNGERYRALINVFFVPVLEDVDVDDPWSLAQNYFQNAMKNLYISN